MNRRGFLRSLLATAALTTGLARASLVLDEREDVLTVERLREAVRILKSTEPTADDVWFLVPRWAAEDFYGSPNVQVHEANQLIDGQLVRWLS